MDRPKPLCRARPAVLQERDDSHPSLTGASRERVVHDPSWADFEAAILRLDNASFTDVSLDFDEGAERTSMMVSGGNADRVVCCVARPDDPAWDQDFRHVVDDGWCDDDELEQVIGGQASALPALLSVPRAMALAAARYFFEHRALSPDVTWRIP